MVDAVLGALRDTSEAVGGAAVNVVAHVFTLPVKYRRVLKFHVRGGGREAVLLVADQKGAWGNDRLRALVTSPARLQRFA